MKPTPFDIETAPRDLTILEKLVPTFTAPSNYKDPEKIAANIAEQKEKWFEKAALSPVTGRVLVIAYWPEDQTAPTILEAPTEADEPRILAAFWDEVRSFQFRIWSGWNIGSFDLDFLIKRSWFHRVPVPMGAIMSGRYMASKWRDLMKVFQTTNFKAEYTSLQDAAEFLGVGTKDADGSKNFAALYAADPEKARAHVTNDLALVHAVGGVIDPDPETIQEENARSA